MKSTYRAIIHGSRVEWIDPPSRLKGDTEVLITVTDTEPEEAKRARRRSAVAALAELAEQGGINSIPDPAGWEREIRRDGPIPGREE